MNPRAPSAHPQRSRPAQPQRSRPAHPKRLRLHSVRRLTPAQWALLLPVLGLVAALALYAVQNIWSFVATARARSRGPSEVCSDFGQVDEIDIVSRSPWGYACESSTAAGFAVQEHSAGTSVMFLLVLALTAISIVAFLGVVVALAVKWVSTTLLGAGEHGTARWGVRMLVTACFVAPWTGLAQHLQWYAASNSGDGSPVCPSTFRGEDILGFSVEASYLPPHLTCYGDTVNGVDFTTTSYGVPFSVFLGCLVLFAVGLALLIVARVRRARRDTPDGPAASASSQARGGESAPTPDNAT